MIFDYHPEKTFGKEIEVKDMGNMCLRITTEDFIDYYLATQTIMGQCYFLYLGPITPDLDLNDGSLEAFSLSYYKMEYSEKKLIKTINQIIQNPRLKIDEIVEVKLEEALNLIPTKEAFIPA